MQSSTPQRSSNSLFWLHVLTSTVSIGFSLSVLWRLRRVHEDVKSIRDANSRLKWEDYSGRSHSRRSIVQREDTIEKEGNRTLITDRSLAIADPNAGLSPECKVEEGVLPLRFLRAGKGDVAEGWRRYEATLKWREENNMDTCLFEAWPKFGLIKNHYPHYLHGKGHNGEPVFYELPPKTDLKALREGGVDIDYLLHHYAMVCEFQWQYISRDDFQKSIYIIDLEGIRMGDFVGECVDYVKRASEFTAQHYPERAGVVFVVNVPYWFKMIWNVVSKWVDEVTLKKIFILRGEAEIYKALLEKVPEEDIPKKYGGKSPYELGDSPEENLLRDLMQHNNEMIVEGKPCCNANGSEPCKFCNFKYVRHY